MRRRRSGKAYRKQFCSIILAAALVMGSVMPAFAAEGGTIASEETAAVSESAAENGTVDETEQITSGEGTEQVTSGDGTEQVTSGDGTDQVMTDEDQAASDDQENPEEGEPAPGEETDVVADQNTGLTVLHHHWDPARIARNHQTGSDAILEYVRVELWDPATEGSTTEFKARRFSVANSVSDISGDDDIVVSGTLHAQGDPVDGTFNVSTKVFTAAA